MNARITPTFMAICAIAQGSEGGATTPLESAVRYLSIEVDDALEIAEQTEVLCIPAGERTLAGQARPFLYAGKNCSSGYNQC